MKLYIKEKKTKYKLDNEKFNKSSLIRIQEINENVNGKPLKLE